MTTAPVVALEDVGVTFRTGVEEVQAISRVNLTIEAATSTSVVGRSGSGKSTLISVLSLLRLPTTGRVVVEGRETSALSDAEVSTLRSRSIGTVFQSFHLDPAFTAEENAMLPWYFGSDLTRRRARTRARDLLDLVGVGELARRRPSQISGGQRQRVAIARALFAQPALLIADEPTGNLDESTAGVIADVLFALPAQTATAVIVVTHDQDIAARAQRRVHLSHGTLDVIDAGTPVAGSGG